jgi:cytochrome b involved in lipid metabolism
LLPPRIGVIVISKQSRNSEAKMSKQFTVKEVAEHKTEEKGLYIIIDGGVFDVSKFLDEHPGGPKILKRIAGKDASKSFWKVSLAKLLLKSNANIDTCSTTTKAF